MSTKAELEVNGITYKVITSSYGFAQKTDDEGKPATQTRGGKMNVSVEATDATDFAEKAVSNEVFGAVKLTYYNNDGSVMKEVNLVDAHLITYKEVYSAEEAEIMIEDLLFSAREITVGNAAHVNNWDGKFAT